MHMVIKDKGYARRVILLRGHMCELSFFRNQEIIGTYAHVHGKDSLRFTGFSNCGDFG